jgi:hypothetical protein
VREGLDSESPQQWADRWLRDLFGPLEYGLAGWVFAVRWEFWRTAMILFAVRPTLKRMAKRYLCRAPNGKRMAKAFFIFLHFNLIIRVNVLKL